MANNNDRIDNYLADQMTPEENDDFLNDLRNDKDLREEAQMMALMIKEMKEEQAQQDSEVIGEVLASKELDKKAKTISIIRWPLSIAAMFILIFGATLLWNRQSDSDTLFSEYYTPYTMQGESRGGDSDVEKELATLFNQIGTADDITPVINQLQKIHDSIDSEYEYSLYADDITWYLALAYIKDKNIDKARSLLKQLTEEGDEKTKNRARKLIEYINNN